MAARGFSCWHCRRVFPVDCHRFVNYEIIVHEWITKCSSDRKLPSVHDALFRISLKHDGSEVLALVACATGINKLNG